VTPPTAPSWSAPPAGRDRAVADAVLAGGLELGRHELALAPLAF
jgi:hypothetical protein